MEALQKLPGVGTKSAQRMALHLLKEGPQAMEHLGDLLQQAAHKVGFCQECGAFTDRPPLSGLHGYPAGSPDPGGGGGSLQCPELRTQWPLPRDATTSWGASSAPSRACGPDQLRVRELLKRLEDGRIQEIVLATNPTLDGEATATWLARILEPLGLRTTRIGLGLPIGSDLEYADDLTLDRAMEGRRLV